MPTKSKSASNSTGCSGSAAASGCALSLSDRISNYQAFSGFPGSLFIAEDGRMVGTWVMGNDYRVKSTYYGGYPPTYLRRIRALFPDKVRTLHLFSGRVDRSVFPGATVDSNPATEPDYLDDAHRLESVPVEDFDLVLADPPYSVEDCDHYQCTMVKRNVVMDALGRRLKPGAHVVWLDQVLPMYRKTEFRVEGYIGLVKSTNHRFRVVTIFCKHGEREPETAMAAAMNKACAAWKPSLHESHPRKHNAADETRER